MAKLAAPPLLHGYTPPGPIAEAYLRSLAPVSFIVGPVGSGKTMVSIQKCILATLMTPVCKDGVIRARGLVARESYNSLYGATLPSWHKIFPPSFPGSEYLGSEGRPAKHLIRFQTSAGQPVEMDMRFITVGEEDREQKLKGFEYNFAWLNEVDQLDQSGIIVQDVYQRLGRYPALEDLADRHAPYHRMVFGDLNPTNVSHWIYRDFVEKPIDDWQLFQQPSGLSSQAENRHNLLPDYYERIAKTYVNNRDELNKRVHGMFGHGSDGTVVYKDFAHHLHVVDDLPPDPLLPLTIGLDAGGTPAAVLVQHTPQGQIRVLDEITTPEGEFCGAARFSEMLIMKLQEPAYKALRFEHLVIDPTAFRGADRIAGELSYAEVISKALHYPVYPCESNEPSIRIDAVSNQLRRLLDGGKPAFVIAKKCQTLVGGFMAHYKFKQHKAGCSVYTDPRPDKNRYSHPHDALQYAVIAIKGRAGVIDEGALAGRAGRLRPPPSAAHRYDFVNPHDFLRTYGRL